MQLFFLIIANLIGVYSLLCLIRIIISWVPQAQNNGFYDFLVKICDPFFGMFRFSFAQVGSLDFSSLIALFFLYIIQQFFQLLAKADGFNALSIVAVFINLIVTIGNFIISLLIVVLLIRLFLEVTGKATRSNYCAVLDQSFEPLYRFVAGFSGAGNRKMTIIAAIVLLFVVRLLFFVLSFFF